MLLSYRLIKVLGIAETGMPIYSQLGIVVHTENDLRFLARSMVPEHLHKIVVSYDGDPSLVYPLALWLGDISLWDMEEPTHFDRSKPL